MATTSPAFAQLPGGTWQYHWGDDFAGDTLDATKWSYNYPWGTTHNHDATMSPDHAVLGDGTLTLIAERTGSGANFTSGAVSTGYNRATFNGGYIEARIRLPDTPGSWPAFWGLYDGWPPESDIMEYPIDTAAGNGYSQDQYHTAFHYRNTSGGNSAGAGQVNPGGVGDLGGTYHTFGMEWREDDWVGYYFNGNLVSQFGDNAAIAQMQHMYLILNYAVGGWPGTPNTTEWPVGHTDETKVDWVRVWKQAAAATSNWAYNGSNTNVSWDSSANWTAGAPNLGGVTSSFGTVAAAQQNIDWSGRRTLSVVNFDGSTRFRLGGVGDRLVLGYGNNGSLGAAINMAASTGSEQEVRADLEFAGRLSLTNNSSYPLLLTGNVMGEGGIDINGPGAVHFGGDNSYGGDTVIDSGPQGPAIAVALGRNAFGLGGNVSIGPGGNSTTAQLQLADSSLVSNNVLMQGRNNTSDAIVNRDGVNEISGTVAMQVGGNQYIVRSTSGTLELSGNSAQAGGVAVRSLASGNRVLTLTGDGDGVISGSIENGLGNVSINLTGGGTWEFRGQNSYTGDTNVVGGTLLVDGTTGHGATNVAHGATLGGRGLVRGNLVAQEGSVIRAGGIGLPLLGNSNYQMIDDFDAYPTGDIGPTATSSNSTGGVWTGVFNGTANADIVDNVGNRALAVTGLNAGSGWRGAITDLSDHSASDFSLAHGETGTYFFRVRRTGTATIDAIFGLTDLPATTTSPPGNDIDSPWNEYAALLSIFGDSRNSTLRAYSEGAGDIDIIPVGTNQWTNVWLTVDNAAKTFRVATSAGSANGVDSGSVYQFGRRTAGIVGSGPLTTFGIHEARNVPVQLDDLYFAEGTDLTNPLYVAPVLTGETLSIGGDFTLDGGTLELDLAGAVWDSVEVVGTATLEGVLSIALHDGFTPARNEAFTVLTAAQITQNLTLGGPDGAKFSLAASNSTELVLTYVGDLPGDFTGDGIVNLADYTRWRDTLGSTGPGLAADANGDLAVDAADYHVWRTNFGSALDPVVSALNQVPEPSTSAFASLVFILQHVFRRRIVHQRSTGA